MSSPNDRTPTNLEPALPELSRLRELARLERAPINLRSSVRTQLRASVEGRTTRALGGANAVLRKVLFGVATAVAVPGALAATDTGRALVNRTLALLPWTAPESGIDERPSSASARRPPAVGKAAAPTQGDETVSPAISVAASSSFPAVPPNGPNQFAPTPLPRTPKPAVALAPNDNNNAAAPNKSPSMTPLASSPQLQLERHLLESARLALSRGDLEAARYWCNQHEAKFPQPVLEQERKSIERLITSGTANSVSGPGTQKN